MVKDKIPFAKSINIVVKIGGEIISPEQLEIHPNMFEQESDISSRPALRILGTLYEPLGADSVSTLEVIQYSSPSSCLNMCLDVIWPRQIDPSELNKLVLGFELSPNSMLARLRT